MFNLINLWKIRRTAYLNIVAVKKEYKSLKTSYFQDFKMEAK